MSEVSGGEEFLIKEGIVSKRSEQRRQALGCLGCIWTRRESEEQPAFATVAEIEACTGVANASVSSIFKQLREIGILSAHRKQSTVKGKAHLQYMPGETDQGKWLHAILDKNPDCRSSFEKTAEELTEKASAQTPGQTAAELIDTLRDRRLELGLSQGDFCGVLGISQSTFSKQETLKHTMDLQAFANYAGALGLRVVLEPIDNLAENDIWPCSDPSADEV
jgi:DNA-binding transcriptional regulator YiaG